MHSTHHNVTDSVAANESLSIYLADESATLAVGGELARLLPPYFPGLRIWLEGDLGAGKTTLVRALLRGLNFKGTVKSPTYSLVEAYVISSLYLYHFDFYRFNEPKEFEDAGLGDYFSAESFCLIEWPEKAAGYIPPPDLLLAFRFLPPDADCLPNEVRSDVLSDEPFDHRRLLISARSARGQTCLSALQTSPQLSHLSRLSNTRVANS